MSENAEKPSNDTPGDGAAAAVALGSASREQADRFLREQTRVAEAQADFIRLQAEDFRSDETLRRRTLKLHHSSAMMKVAFEIAVALVAVLLFVIVGSALWSAAHDDGLVIESFSVPPDMAGRGLTGDVVAARLLDKLAHLQKQTVSNRAASSYANNWGNDIKVQIPDTGISIGQAYAYLAQWLGHETHISGEVWRDSKGGISLTARVGADASPNFDGAESDFDKLLQQAAESVYQKTQPYRYAVYLSNRGRTAEAEAAYRALLTSDSAQERAWAYIGLSTLQQAKGDLQGGIASVRHSLEGMPDFAMAYIDWANAEGQLQHDEASLVLARKLVDIIQRGDDTGIDRRALNIAGPQFRSAIAAGLGDFTSQLALNKETEKLPEYDGQVENARENDIQAYAFLHDGAGMRSALARAQPGDGPIAINRDANLIIADYLLEDWGAVLSNGAKLDAELAQLGPLGAVFTQRGMWPLIAVAKAMTGDAAGGDALIAKTPLDCDVCVRQRGRIARAERRWDAAAYWYTIVSARSPSIPFADTDWGAMLVAKGDVEGAIAKFQSANRKGPHFADPLEMWGEALMTKSRSDLAVAKFEEANKYAANWGRLHLKWGEALLYSGKPADAQKQFAIASALDLAAADRTELTKMSAQHG